MSAFFVISFYDVAVMQYVSFAQSEMVCSSMLAEIDCNRLPADRTFMLEVCRELVL